MSRFSPWHASLPVDVNSNVGLIEAVLRPGLQQAFPLPGQSDDPEGRFEMLLVALGQLSRDTPRPPNG